MIGRAVSETRSCSGVTGKSAYEHMHGEPFWDRLRKHPDEYEQFNRALSDLRSDEHQKITGAYDWSGLATAVDVGGGAGSLIAAFLEMYPDKRGVGPVPDSA